MRLEGYTKWYSEKKDCYLFKMVVSFPAEAPAVGRIFKDKFIEKSAFDELDKSMIGKEITCTTEEGAYYTKITHVSAIVNNK